MLKTRVTRVPTVVVIKQRVVSEQILCRDANHQQEVFLNKLSECLSNWDEYTDEDKEAILENGYEEMPGVSGSICMSWAMSPDDED